VVPQRGKLRYSTEQGRWQFETARFSGEGQYEVLATVSLGGRTDFQKVMVKCIPKEIAYQQAIDKDRKIRGASTLLTVPRDPGQLLELKGKLNMLQQEFFVLLKAGDLDGAEANVARTLDLLDSVLPSHPNDWDLQNVRAYTFKNYAYVMRRRGNEKEAHRALVEAERMFENIREQKPDDAGAWNGLGSVAILMGEPERAMVYIDRALELNPNYNEAKRDRKIAEKMLQQKDKNSTKRRP
jgi:tetratricopeptide (TPR) repeat protein